MAAGDFYRVVTAAIADFSANGFDSEQRLKLWTDRIARAALVSMTPPDVMERILRASLTNVYDRLVERKTALKAHPGASRFTIERIKPKLRGELDRRIAASAQLIKLNRQQAIETTLRRFSGWATSIPVGGSLAVDKLEESKHVRKALGSLDFEQRRVAIDQGHKLAASINEVIAVDGGAIALVWNSHWRQPGYDYRMDHRERDKQVYLVRGNWAQAKGLIKPGPAGYYDKITAVGEEVFCRCYATWLYSLRQLPSDMLTVKGREALDSTRKAIAAA